MNGAAEGTVPGLYIQSRFPGYPAGLKGEIQVVIILNVDDVDFAAVGFNVAMSTRNEVELAISDIAGMVGPLTEPAVIGGSAVGEGCTCSGKDVATPVAGKGKVLHGDVGIANRLQVKLLVIGDPSSGGDLLVLLSNGEFLKSGFVGFVRGGPGARFRIVHIGVAQLETASLASSQFGPITSGVIVDFINEIIPGINKSKKLPTVGE